MLIAFSGTQRGMTKFQKDKLIELLALKGCTEFHHGDCIGADAQANTIAYDYGIKLFTIHPPIHDHKRAFCFAKIYHATDWIEYEGVKIRWREPKPFLIRNEEMIRETALLLACPKEFRHTIRSGTWTTIRYAWKHKLDCIIIPPVERPENENKNSEENKTNEPKLDSQ